MWGAGFGFLYGVMVLISALMFVSGWNLFGEKTPPPSQIIVIISRIGRILLALLIYPLQLFQLLEKVLPGINSPGVAYVYAFICGFIIGTGIFFIKNKISRKPLSPKAEKRFTTKKKIITAVTIIAISMFMGTTIKVFFIVQECENRMTCIGNLKVMGMALRMFAQDNRERFPDGLSELYPRYAGSLKTFICPSHRPGVTKTDIEQNFEVCYQYVAGLTTEHDANCLVVIEKKENHLTKPFFLNCTKPVRGVVFVSSCYRFLYEEEWREAYRKHQKLIKNLSFSEERKCLEK